MLTAEQIKLLEELGFCETNSLDDNSRVWFLTDEKSLWYLTLIENKKKLTYGVDFDGEFQDKKTWPDWIKLAIAKLREGGII